MVAEAKLAARKEKESKRREAMANKLKLKKDEEVEAKRLREEEEVRTACFSHLSCTSSSCSHLILIYTCIILTQKERHEKAMANNAANKVAEKKEK